MRDSASSIRAPPDVVEWPYVVGSAGGVFVGGVLLLAALSKAADPVAFRELIAVEGLDFLFPAWLVAPLAVALEGGLGVALILGLRRWWILGPAFALAVFFLFLTGRAYYDSVYGAMDPSTNCGCFGNLVDRSPAEAFWQDLALLLPPLFLACLGREKDAGLPSKRLIGIGVSVVAMIALGQFASDLDLDDLATRLKPGRHVTELCSGEGSGRVCVETLMPELTAGDHLVVLASLSDEAFAAQVPTLNEYAMSGAEPMLWVLCDATEDEKNTWFWTHAPSFEVRLAPHALLRPLYRRLPRSFRVRDGRVTETYDGMPDLAVPSGSD